MIESTVRGRDPLRDAPSVSDAPRLLQACAFQRGLRRHLPRNALRATVEDEVGSFCLSDLCETE